MPDDQKEELILEGKCPGRPGALATAPTLPAGPYPGQVTAVGRTYQIRTYGCQMNAHDSERLAGLLDEAGYRPAADGQTPDVVVFNTCAVRENAADRLYGNLGHLLPAKQNGMQIAVGGCLAQMERTKITQRAPWVDVVYGTHNMGSLPALLERARVRGEAQVEFAETLETFPSLLPARRQSAYSAWVSISVGCNNTCTFCIVPALRGKEKRPSTRRDPRRDPGARRRRRHRGHAPRPKRQLLRRRVRRPAGIRQAAACRRPDRGTGAHPLHQPASRCVHG